MEDLKLGLSKKEIKKYVFEKIKEGIEKSEIENKLKEVGYTETDYKKAMSLYPSLEMMKKYKKLNLLLFSLLLLVSILYLFGSLFLIKELGFLYIIPLFVFCLMATLAYGVINYNRKSYIWTVVIAWIAIFQSSVEGYIGILVLLKMLLIIFLSIFLIIKLYPNLSNAEKFK